MTDKVKQLKKAYESELDNICERIAYLEIEKKVIEEVIENLEDISTEPIIEEK